MKKPATNLIIRLRSVRLLKGHSQYSLGVHCGVSQKHISHIEQGKADPTIGTLSRIAAALRVPIGDLIADPSKAMPNGLPNGLPPIAYQLSVFKEMVVGDPSSATQERPAALEVRPGQYGGGRYILKFRGQSMDPKIHSGDLLLVDNTVTARAGDIIACTINGKKMLRRYEKKRTAIVLRADNPSINPVVVTADDEFQVHGVVLEIVSRKLR